MYKSPTYILIICFACLSSIESRAQQGAILPFKVEQGDTVYQIQMRELQIYPRPAFKDNKARRDYQRLVYNFRKTYPYALTAKKRMQEIDSAMANIPDEASRDAYIKQKEKDLFKEFEKPLRKLTYSQGKLLLRLIDREIGQTSYYLIKDLRGGFTAFFWQNIAKFFGANLKKPYDKYGEDKPVEELVLMYHNGTLDDYYNRLFQ
ncbi:MAG: DUF4294 domain-containing protein [Prevotellaceae bacterium]|jgi:hypothetical protein|nr:DUF4294 domain-containing protein [Prevotellaceae bacterium]